MSPEGFVLSIISSFCAYLATIEPRWRGRIKHFVFFRNTEDYQFPFMFRKNELAVLLIKPRTLGGFIMLIASLPAFVSIITFRIFIEILMRMSN